MVVHIHKSAIFSQLFTNKMNTCGSASGLMIKIGEFVQILTEQHNVMAHPVSKLGTEDLFDFAKVETESKPTHNT